MANARSVINQGLYLQREATPGTPATDAMRRYLGIGGNIGWDIQKETYTVGGYKAPTGESILTEMGTADLTVMQDFNAFLPLLAGRFGEPETEEVEPGVYEHVFTIDPRAADDQVVNTAVWGDSTQALLASYMAFHGLTIGVQRTSLSMSANAILRKPETAVLPTTGVTEVPMIPMRAAKYDVFMDEEWDDLGTTQLLALYSAEATFGDKFEPDWIVNSNLESFSELLEAENVNHDITLQVGFDAAASNLIDDALNGEMKFVRITSTGPLIGETSVPHAFELDMATRLVPGNTGRSNVSVATVVNFTGEMQVDGESGNLARARLVNGLATL